MKFPKPFRGYVGVCCLVAGCLGVTELTAADQPKQGKKKAAAAAAATDPGAGAAVAKDGKPADPKAGPITPELLHSEVEAPPEFDVSVFATPDQANYPVYVASSPEGTLYVASDGNASMGTDPGRGRILRLRDTNDDGKADEVKVFAKVDSPRGLVWDIDRLYLMHPPHLSVFIDKDGDGVADEQKILVKNVGWGLKDRPADHASNGVALGVDGWLYLAIGDFGFMEAEGTDGRKLELRGGGVVRVRTDGTGLELFSRGTRNIVDIAVGPLLDAIARDNTNDGDGWDVRLHQFTGLEDHGYPTLYRNFAEDAVPPLMDYGGGSGCGAQWIDEPGIPAKWRGPMTVDWGRESVFLHGLTPKGASYTVTQERFVKLPRATDLDVDARSRVYVTSWRGGKFTYSGAEIGYIARLTPKDYTPPPVPDFAKLANAKLVKLLNSPSTRIRMEAQRTLLRRNLRAEKATLAAIEALATGKSNALVTRVIALFTLKQALGDDARTILARLAVDSSVSAWALRALVDNETQLARVPAEPMLAALKLPDARTRIEAMVALARLGRAEHAPVLVRQLGSDDPVIAHTAVQAMVRLRAIDAALGVVDLTDVSAAQRTGALRVLQALHEEKVVDALIARLGKEKDAERREGLIRALCRLYYVEGKWTGGGWGTRPDTRGPYYQPERWSASEKINTALGKLLDGVTGEETTKLNALFTLHRVTPGDMLGKLLALAQTDDSVLPSLTEQLVAGDTVPASALPLLVRAAKPAAPKPGAKGGAQPGPAQVDACYAMIKLGTPEAVRALLEALPLVPKNGSRGDAASDKVSNAFFLSSALENQHRLVAEEAAKLDGQKSIWADAALLQLAARKFGSPEAREGAAKALDDGWKTPGRRAQIIRGAAMGREASRAKEIVAALDDPDAAVVEAAKFAVKGLRLDPEAMRNTANDPLIANLNGAAVLDQATALRGDRARGEQLFTQAGCIACHTVNASEAQRGPFLGNIATLYRRRELAEAILEPSKTLAQGFVTNQFTLKDGSTRLGFVTREGADIVAIRDIAGQAQEIKMTDVVKREHLTMSLMPPGLMSGFTVRDLASLLDYLEAQGKTAN
ncbi:MAG: c-type cytochrome [Verrucomicrobiota bacterium]